MIRIIVYSTTNTAAKMYRKKKKKHLFKVTQEEIMAGTQDHGEPTCPPVCAYGGLYFSPKGKNIKF